VLADRAQRMPNPDRISSPIFSSVLVRIASPGAAPEVVAAPLIGPAGMAYDPVGDRILVTEAFTGLVRVLPLD